MKGRFIGIYLLLLLSFSWGIAVMTPISMATPSDSFKVKVNDEFTWVCTYSIVPNVINASDQIKIVITKVNNTYFNSSIYSAFSYYADTVYGDYSIALAGNGTFSTPVEELLGAYNATCMLNWFRMFGGYYSGTNISAAPTNLTAFNISMFVELGMINGVNQSLQSGLTFIYWNGTADGNGGRTAMKYVYTLDDSSYIISSISVYNNSGSAWDLIWQIAFPSTSSPPLIPGFEFMFIFIVLGGIISVYVWRRKEITI
ncbi:MAG: hypothetical protein EAX96_08845 [Candidatus Lokiarchaeota archaeon]|nr:hypothetical protein [Candidatus Lokiarchaeota archaeon]